MKKKGSTKVTKKMEGGASLKEGLTLQKTVKQKVPRGDGVGQRPSARKIPAGDFTMT